MRFVVLIGFGLVSLASIAEPKQVFANSSVEKGREIVREHCTRCHVVPGMNPYGGIGSTPSFSAMKWLDDWMQRFEIFFTLPPHPSLVSIEDVSEERSAALPVFSKEIVLALEDVDYILEFVKTLKTPK